MFEKHGVPVLPGRVAESPAEARAAAEALGGGLTVVKAQVKTGGRGKAGGVKLARTPEDAAAMAEQILGMDINGHIAHRVMVAQGADIAHEYYFSVLLDRAEQRYLALCSTQGGVDIETLAVENPEALARVPVSPAQGIDAAKAREITEAAGFDAEVGSAVAEVLVKLWEVFEEEDASLVEVNPLVRLATGEIVALDGKVTLDANADFRHEDRAALAGSSPDDPLEARAAELGLNYVKLDGNIGIIGNGAGLVMSTLDVVAQAGRESVEAGGAPASPANFLDIGGGASAEVMAAGLGLVLGDPQVESVFVNVFGGITACDEVARGITGALEQLGDAAVKPLVVRLDGNAVEEGRAILERAEHPLVTAAHTMDGGARAAVELASAGEQG